MTFQSLQPIPFCLKVSSVRTGIFECLTAFQCEFVWSKVKFARITITHVCFIALKLAGSLRRCFSPLPISLVFKQLPLDLANVNASKNMCDPYICIASNK